MKTLMQMSHDLMEKLKKCTGDDDIAGLGFNFVGRLKDYEGYGEFNERIWLWSKEVDNKICTIGVFDYGNANCIVTHFDVLVKELL